MDEARWFTDRFGFRWQVCELPARTPGRVVAADLAPRGGGELYFFARGTTLVLRDYPAEWGDMSPRELERLREGAVVLGSGATAVIPRQAMLAKPDAPARAMISR